MHILAGSTAPTAGLVEIGGVPQRDYGPRAGQKLGIRCVFQELSLCPNLTAAENTRVIHASARGFSWRRRSRPSHPRDARRDLSGHGIGPVDLVQDLPIGQRQMVEVARAFTVTDDPLQPCHPGRADLLPRRPHRQSASVLYPPRRQGASCILISHLLGEVLKTCRASSSCATARSSPRDRRRLSTGKSCVTRWATAGHAARTSTRHSRRFGARGARRFVRVPARRQEAPSSSPAAAR